VLTAGFLWIGFFPAPTLELMSVSIHALSNIFAIRF